MQCFFLMVIGSKLIGAEEGGRRDQALLEFLSPLRKNHRSPLAFRSIFYWL